MSAREFVMQLALAVAPVVGRRSFAASTNPPAKPLAAEGSFAAYARARR